MDTENVPEYVGTSEAAELLGVEKPRIGRYIKAGRMPEPVASLKATPVWRTEDVLAFRDDREPVPYIDDLINLPKDVLRAMAGELAIDGRSKMDHDQLIQAIGASRRLELDLVGTREAAELLKVERTRIGRYIKSGRMPAMLVKLKATPVWRTEDVEVLANELAADRAERAAKLAQ